MSEEDSRSQRPCGELPRTMNSAGALEVGAPAGAELEPVADAATRRRRNLMLLALWESGQTL